MAKTKSCCVTGCKNQNVGADSGVIFYKFPEEKKLRKSWIDACVKNEAIKEANWSPTNETVICNVHFVTGQKNPNDWHPDYVPSVFRSLRRVITKAKGKHLDESYETKPVTKKPKPAIKRTSLATPTRNTPKNRDNALSALKKPFKLSVGRPKKVVLLKEEDLTPIISSGSVEKPKKIASKETDTAKSSGKKPKKAEEGTSGVRKTPKKAEPGTSGRPKKPEPGTGTSGRTKKVEVKNIENELNDDCIDEVDPLDISQEGDENDDNEEPVPKLSEAGRPIRNKRKRFDDEFEEGDIDEDAPQMKTLSVVLERTSDKRIKLSTGEITIKEEPESEGDYMLSPLSEGPSGKKPCRKCHTLEQRVKRLEACLKNSPGSDGCTKCPIIEGKLQKVEDELDQIIDAKVSKCQRCTLLDHKCKRIENNLRKLHTDVNKLQSKLTSVELNEETFKKYKNKVKMYTGFPNYDALMLVFDHLKPHLPSDTVKFLSQFQKFIIVLMRLKLNFPFWDLTYRFGASPNHIQSFYPQYISVIEAQLSHVVLWPKAKLLHRLDFLAGNLKQSYAIIQQKVDVNKLIIANDGTFTEEDKVVRVCSALYHISQLVSSNHSQQLMKILKNRDKTDRSTILDKTAEPSIDSEKDDKNEELPIEKKLNTNKSDGSTVFMNGSEEVNDSDIFFEDMTMGVGKGVNSNESLKLECKYLVKELENVNQKLCYQFRFFTGMRNFEVFNNLLGFLQSHVTHISKEKLTYFQQLHMVLMRLKLNLEVQDISYMFKVDPDHVVYLTKLWIDVFVKKLSRYIDWPAGVEDFDGEKRLLGTVKLKYQILWSPHCAPRNKETGREKERFDSRQLLRACAALYNIDDIEVFKDGKRESKTFQQGNYDDKTNEELEQSCRDLRTELYDLRKSILSSIATCFTEDQFKSNDLMVQFYTGFPSYEMLKNVFNLIIPVSKTESRKAVPHFQQFLIVLIRLKLNISTQDLSYRFGLGHSNTHKFIQDWLVLLHSQLAPHITWPDDDEDVEVFTDMLRKTYAYLRNTIYPRKREIDPDRKHESGVYDIATLVCAGLYNVGEVSFCEQSDSEFESFDEEW